MRAQLSARRRRGENGEKTVKSRTGVAFAVVVPITALVLFLFLGFPQERRGFIENQADGLASEDMGAWVSISDPERAAPGYTLFLFGRRVPFLMDLTGRAVHSWPEVHAVGRARLSHDGHLLVISPEDRIEEYDWEGRLLFRYALPEGHTPHHDVIQLRNGNILVLANFRAETETGSRPGVHGYLREVDREGATVWRWDAVDHAHRFEAWNDRSGNPTHINSVHELGDNPAFAAGDERFRPGNLLVSGRNLHTIFVIDKVSGEVVWQLSEGLDFQYEALMIPAGHARAGHVIVFNNGLGDRQMYRRSRVQIFDPRTLEKVWEYSAPFFYSPVEGLAQPLWNGNVMVVTSGGRRVFEVAPDGDIVWQWEPPFNAARPIRYPRDHSPQLADLNWERPMARTRATPFLDKGLYDFLVPVPGQPSRKLPGWEGRALREPQSCRQLIIPPDARLRVRYGLHREALNDRPFAARFVVEIRDTESGETTRVLDDEVRSDQITLARQLKVSLAGHAFANTDVCLDAQPLGKTRGVSPRKAMVWIQPRIASQRANRDAEPELTKTE